MVSPLPHFTTVFIQSRRSFKRVSSSKIRQFSLDLCFVSLGIRTGYLFDAFALPGLLLERRVALFCDLLAAAVFQDVIVLHEPTSDQLFFVNLHLLERRCAQTLGSDNRRGERHQDAEPWPAFLHLLVEPTLVGFPKQLAALLRELCARGEKHADLPRPTILTISHPIDITVSVPLAAVLLEYPVAYVPLDADQTVFLTGVGLDVYDCVLTFSRIPDSHDTGRGPDGPYEHRLLKFSCPSRLAREATTLLPTTLIARMQAKFGPRLDAAGCQCNLTVRHATETHDRVSL
ncbi:hypothetical protein FOMPIDRAFT_1111773 [Fomitopsis schrenkii]|uniref:Uncharacterized protein n=1 Tax=Fomitopsis schrenkii TaxID=2126942 RepID=S8FW26_FOMSC|nr:hypothetical protein FOMPIDRAFT_1111773 [Fomitopsis schrenkii]